MAQNTTPNQNFNPDPYSNPYGENLGNIQPPINQNAVGIDPYYNPSNYDNSNQPIQPQNNYETNFQQTDLGTLPTLNQNEVPDYNQQNSYSYQNDQNSNNANTFEEKKSGNKLFLVIGGIIIAGLIIATGVLIYLNFSQSNTTKTTSNTTTQPVTNTTAPTTNTSPTTTPQPTTNPGSPSGGSTNPTPNTSLTGGPSTPATQAKKFNVTQIPTQWLLQKFRSPDIDNDGKCLNATKCGEQSDADDDGLSTLDEYNFQTDPISPDTDLDGLADGNEAFIYYTDPTKKDSDSDTFADGIEIVNCYDPATTQSPKMNATRLAKIAESTGLKPLKKPTTTTLTTAGGTTSDITKGYLAKCDTVSTTPSAPTSTPTNTTPRT